MGRVSLSKLRRSRVSPEEGNGKPLLSNLPYGLATRSTVRLNLKMVHCRYAGASLHLTVPAGMERTGAHVRSLCICPGHPWTFTFPDTPGSIKELDPTNFLIYLSAPDLASRWDTAWNYKLLRSVLCCCKAVFQVTHPAMSCLWRPIWATNLRSSHHSGPLGRPIAGIQSSKGTSRV